MAHPNSSLLPLELLYLESFVFWGPWWVFWGGVWFWWERPTNMALSVYSCRCEIQRSMRTWSGCGSMPIFYANAMIWRELPAMVRLLNASLAWGILTHSRLRRRSLLCSSFLNWHNQGGIHLRSPALQNAVGECHKFPGAWQQANCKTARRFPTLKPMEQQTGPQEESPALCSSLLCRKLCYKCYKTQSKKLNVPLLVAAVTGIRSAAVHGKGPEGQKASEVRFSAASSTKERERKAGGFLKECVHGQRRICSDLLPHIFIQLLSSHAPTHTFTHPRGILRDF